MRNDYDDRFWAENHQLLSDGIDRGVRRLGALVRRLARRVAEVFGPDRSEEAKSRTYCIG